ncbi:MAG: NAD(+) diphosphatase [Kiritimatiellae bacterium]|jgi:NAD+ diphosphatase|nr:NAD(+) diphosphatase [Kiritimatiellia bacterium]
MSQYILLDGEEIWIEDHPANIIYLFSLPENPDAIKEEIIQGIYARETRKPPTAIAQKVNIRKLFEMAGPEAFNLAGKAHQILFWRHTHQYCGKCGSPLIRDHAEHAMLCTACKLFFYPRINPVVITLIHKGDAILLAKRTDPGFNHFWSVIAGFVEAGEPLEEAVQREITEEVGLKVRNIRYISSQQWPFPNNLMVGFYAEYDSGEITPDGDEIAEAQWFTKDELPRIPSKVSIARHLIDSFFEM